METGEIGEQLDGVFAELRALAAAERAVAMSAYMHDRFRFLGVPAPERRRIAKPLVRAAKTASAPELIETAHRCWAELEREFRYIGVDILRAGAHALRADDLDAVRYFIATESWWDTVDLLAAWTVGPMVSNHPQLGAAMDEWIDDPDMWIARTAILHQLGFKDLTDTRRLFAYSEKRADDTEFFIRKAIGWALRQYAREDPDLVRQFVAANDDRLSALTKREALKHVGESTG